jgi:dihydrodipicolinate synthase/N-acetylneuraminate lyase
MIKTRQIKGVVPVLLTLFTKEGGIDEEALERLLEYLLSKDIGGLWVLGTGSEDMGLSFDKRLQVARCVARVNKGRVPAILGAGFYALEDSINFMDATRELEYDGYHFMPYHPLYSIERMQWHYRTLADAASKPLWMYTSANWCRKITPDDILALKDHPNIAGVKFSTSNASDAFKVINAQEPGFQVVTAVASQFFVSLSMGAKATTSELACSMPDHLIAIYKAFEAGDLAGAKQKQILFNKINAGFPKGPSQDNFLKGAEGKYILSLQGICDPYMSGYYRELDDDEKAQIRHVVDQFGLIDART